MNIPEFGIKRENEVEVSGGCAIIFDPATKKYAVGKQENGRLRLFSGGVDKSEDIEKGVLREVAEESGLHDFLHVEKIGEAYTHYYNSLKNSNRVGYATCFLMVLRSADLLPLKLEAHEKFTLDWATAKEMLQDWESRNENKDNDHWIYFFKKAVEKLNGLEYGI